MTSSLTCISPIDNSVYVSRPFAGREEIQGVLDKSVSAFGAWKSRPLSSRQSLCAAAMDSFETKKDQIVEEITWQMGRPIRSAGSEVDGMLDRARTMIRLAGQGLAPLILDEKKGFRRWIQREPLGVVFVIAPWNYPYLTAINAWCRRCFPAIP